jgi:rhodanese-related sulfurtransferase
MVLDVRRRVNVEESPASIPGALYYAPERVEEWQGTLPTGRPLVVYCVHGRQVSQGVASQLASIGLSARYLEGGIEAWKRDGGAVVEGGPMPS